MSTRSPESMAWVTRVKGGTQALTDPVHRQKTLPAFRWTWELRLPAPCGGPFYCVQGSRTVRPEACVAYSLLVEGECEGLAHYCNDCMHCLPAHLELTVPPAVGFGQAQVAELAEGVECDAGGGPVDVWVPEVQGDGLLAGGGGHGSGSSRRGCGPGESGAPCRLLPCTLLKTTAATERVPLLPELSQATQPSKAACRHCMSLVPHLQAAACHTAPLHPVSLMQRMEWIHCCRAYSLTDLGLHCLSHIVTCSFHSFGVGFFWSSLSVVQFLDFCKHYRELRSMGFPAASIAGALVSHECDMAAATEACLAAQWYIAVPLGERLTAV